MIKGSTIRSLREEKGYSQEYMTKALKVSRPSYAAIEKGEKDLTLSQAERLAAIFGMSLADFVSGNRGIEVEFEPEDNKSKNKNGTLRISVPAKNVKKFREVFLYILEKVGNKPNVGMTVLYKLLYFIDFDYFEKYEEQLMGATYIKNHYGPTPVEFKKVVDDLIKKEELVEVKNKYFTRELKKYIPRRSADLSMLSANEIKHIDEELVRFSDKNATELSEFSHRDIPWVSADEGAPLDYESVFYRSEETSVREYGKDVI